RQWHLLENGERELLMKIYDPDGRVVARQVAENDCVVGTSFLPEAGGWDHEMWYYTLMYSRGTQPMLRWSSLTDPLRLATLPKGTTGINLGFAEFDQPVTRTFKVTASDGTVLWDGPARGGFQSDYLPLDPAGKYDDQMLAMEVSDGTGDYMMHIQFTREDVKV